MSAKLRFKNIYIYITPIKPSFLKDPVVHFLPIKQLFQADCKSDNFRISRLKTFIRGTPEWLSNLANLDQRKKRNA